MNIYFLMDSVFTPFITIQPAYDAGFIFLLK